MPDLETMTPGQILADASVADFIKSLGLAIAEAQTALDANSVNQIPEFVKPIEAMGGKTLLDLGLSPAFYHYQHADLTCSLQLTLKVGTNLNVGVGLNGSYGAGGTSTSSGTTSETESESGSSSSTSEKSAQVRVTSSSTGSLAVGDRRFALTGPDALSRIRALQDAVTGDATAGVPRALYEAPDDTFTITTDAPASRVVTTNRTVAFTGAGFASGFIRIDSNTDTEYGLNAGSTVTTTAQADLDAYATHVAAQISAVSGFRATAYPAGVPIERVHFRTGRHNIEQFTAEGEARNDGLRDTLEGIAQMVIATGLRIEVVGHTDTQPYPGGTAASDEANRALGDRRAAEVRDALLSYGAPPANIVAVPSTGVQDARAAGGAADQVRWRNADIRFADPMRLVIVHATGTTPSLEDVTPDNLTPPARPGNAWFYLYKPRAESLSGRQVTIDGTAFPLSGAAAGEGAGSGTPQAHARNLATSINGNSALDYTASADANVVTVYRKTSPFTLTLYSTESRDVTLSGTEGVTVSRQFSRTSSSSGSTNETSNSTVAFGGTIDVRYGRQFETTITGNSSITARLVSIPAPPQFLEAIRDFLGPEA